MNLMELMVMLIWRENRFLKGEILLENLIIGGVILIDNYPKDV